MRSIPNFITSIRLVLVPLFILILTNPSDFSRYLAACIFIFAAFTDYLDGAIARHYGAVSNFGKLFDPLADKLLVMSGLIMLTSMKLDSYGLPCRIGDSCDLGQSWVPSWMVIMILGREFWVTGVRAVAAEKGMILAAAAGGKLKSFLQMVAIPLILIHDIELAIPFSSVNTNCYITGLYLLFLSLVVSYWSAIEYSFTVLGAPAVLTSPAILSSSTVSTSPETGDKADPSKPNA